MGKDSELAPLLESAEKIAPRMIELRRSIHREPEIGLQNDLTRAKILDDLADLDLDITLHERTSGVVAVLSGSRPGRRVLLRGDTDALAMPEATNLEFRSRFEGRMHACGHDAHTAMLAGAARLLAERRESIAGEVVFMFQPGEEGLGGAEIMLEEGMPSIDGAFALHVAPQIPTGRIGTKPGSLMASFDNFAIDVVGRGGHASMPHDCIDPIPIACEIVGALQAFATRRIRATDPGVITVSQFHAGSAINVIPDSAQIQGTMRALSNRTRARMLEGLTRVCEGIAQTHGATATVEITAGYPVVVNDVDFESFVRSVAGELLGEESILSMGAPIMGAEDFAYILDRTPGTMILLGARPPGVADPDPCHSSRMMLDESAMSIGAALHVGIATRFLSQEP